MQNDEEYREYLNLAQGELKSLYKVDDPSEPKPNPQLEQKLAGWNFDHRALEFMAKSLLK